MIGGAVTFVNPEPLALFADVIAAGEGEVLIPALDARRSRDGLGSRRTCCSRLAAERGFYIPSFYDVRYAADGTIAAFEPQPGTGAPAGREESGGEDAPISSIRRRRRSSRPTPSSARGSSSRSCAAARTCAASAGRATTTCRCAPFPADRILELAREARVHANRVGLVSIALCDHPEIERILRA